MTAAGAAAWPAEAGLATDAAGFIAVVAGWVVTEVGRQPWVVYGLLRTRDAVSPSLTGGDVVISMMLYVAVYAVVFGAGLYYLVRLVRAGPPEEIDVREPELRHRPARPLSAPRKSPGRKSCWKNSPVP